MKNEGTMMQRMSDKMIAVIALFAFSQTMTCGHVRADGEISENSVDLGVGISWESKYVSEGRDNLDHGGLFSLESSLEESGFVFGLWYAVGNSVNYQELDFSAEYHYEVAGCDLSVGYTRLEFLQDHDSDNEVYAGLSCTGLPWVTPNVSYVYSTEAEGAFVELGLGCEIDLIPNKVTVCPHVLEGFDFGYASEQYDGPNNLQIGIEANITVTQHIQLTCHVSHSWAHEDIDREEGANTTWAGIGLSANF